MRISSAFLLTFMARESTLIFSFLNTVLLARCLGAEGMGVYALLLTSANVLAFAGTMGFNFSNTLLAARDPGRSGVLFTQSLIPVLLLAGPAVLVDRFWPESLEFLFGASTPKMRLYALAGTGLLVLNLNLSAVFFGLQRFKRHSIVTLVVAPGMLLTNACLLWGGGLDVRRALEVWLVWQSSSLVLTVVLLGGVARPCWSWNAAGLAESFRVGGRALLTTILGFVVHRGTVLMISEFLGKAAVGLYAVALPMAEALQHAPSALGAIVSTKASAGENSAAQVARLIRVHLLFSGLLALGLVLLAPLIFQVFFGHEFMEAVLPFRILLVGHYALGAWSLASGYLSGKLSYPPVVILLTLGVAVLNLGLGMWWIRTTGLEGAAAAWTVVSAAGSLAMLWAFRKEAGGQVRWRDLVPAGADLRFAWSALRSALGFGGVR